MIDPWLVYFELLGNCGKIHSWNQLGVLVIITVSIGCHKVTTSWGMCFLDFRSGKILLAVCYLVFWQSWALKETFKLRKVERLLTYTVLGKVLSQGVLNYLFIKYRKSYIKLPLSNKALPLCNKPPFQGKKVYKPHPSLLIPPPLPLIVLH